MTEEKKFIKAFEGPWHLAKVSEMRGDKTGELIASFVVTACNGKQIGGPWGHRTWKHADAPAWRDTCKNCQKLINKERNQ